MMQTTARQVLQAIRGVSQRELGRAGRAQRSGADPQAVAIEAMADLTPGEQRWMRYLAQLTTLCTSIRRLKSVSNLDCHLRAVEDRYSDRGSIPASFLAGWALANTSAEGSQETMASVVAELMRALGAPERLATRADAFAASYCGFYRIKDRRGQIILLEEIISGESFSVRISRRYPGRVGATWWVRLLPNPDGSWTALGSPYVFRSPDAADRLRAYFARTLVPLSAESYRNHMRRGATRWLDFIAEAYVGSGDARYLAGVPDRPSPPPYPRRNTRRGPDPREQARSVLLQWAEQAGWTRCAIDAFRTARRHLGLDDLPPIRWSEAERTAARAYALYGHVDDRGCTAIEVALDDDRGQFQPSHRAELEPVRSGWFSAFEVTHRGADRGVGLRDVLRRRRIRVDAQAVSGRISPGDVIAGWVTVERDGDHRLETFIRAPAAIAPRLLRTIHDLNRLFRDGLPELPATKRLGLLAPYAALAVVQLRSTSQSTPVDPIVKRKYRRGKKRPMTHQLALFDVSEFELGSPASGHQFG